MYLTVPLMLASCSEAPAGAIQFDLEAIPKQPWTATGELVDAGLMCPEGSRHDVEVFHPDGTIMTMEDVMRLFEKALAGEMSWGDLPFLAEEEYTCSDGSGSFTTMEAAMASEWKVIGGTGAYAGMTGGGTGTYVPAPAPTGPDDPPKGFPIYVRLTGTLEMSGAGD